MCETKVCSKCKIEKLLDDFHKHKLSKDGHRHECKECVSKIEKDRAEYYKNNLIIITEKRCSRCNIIKPVSEFNKKSYSKDGYSPACKNCASVLYGHKIPYNNIKHDINDTKQCSGCKEIKNINEFYVNTYHKDGLCSRCKQCSDIRTKKYRQNNPAIDRKHQAKRKNFGYKSINKTFNWCDSHHLHLENSHDFVINIPCWLHRLYRHNSFTWKEMDTINAIALDYWVNEEFYKELYEL